MTNKRTNSRTLQSGSGKLPLSFWAESYVRGHVCGSCKVTARLVMDAQQLPSFTGGRSQHGGDEVLFNTLTFVDGQHDGLESVAHYPQLQTDSSQHVASF